MANSNYSKPASPATPLIAQLWHEHSPNICWVDPYAVPDTPEDMAIFFRHTKRGVNVNLLFAADAKDYRIIFTTQFLQSRFERIRNRIALRRAEQLPLIIDPENDLHLELDPVFFGGGL